MLLVVTAGSNALDDWAAATPMDTEERLLVQASMSKAYNPATKVWIYRNRFVSAPRTMDGASRRGPLPRLSLGPVYSEAATPAVGPGWPSAPAAVC